MLLQLTFHASVRDCHAQSLCAYLKGFLYTQPIHTKWGMYMPTDMPQEQGGSGKKRVNLYLDEALVNKCKDMGINLSQATTKILEGLPELDASKNKFDSYEGLYSKIVPILQHHQISIKIAEIFDNFDDVREIGGIGVYLYPDGSKGFQGSAAPFAIMKNKYLKLTNLDSYGFEITDFEKFITSVPVSSLYEPSVIFSNLLDAIKQKKEKDKEEVLEIEKIKRLITAIEPELLETTRRPMQ